MGVATPIAISSCGKKIPVTNVKLNDNSIFLSLNGPNSFYKLTATILPENATNKNVSWSSSNEFIATVDQNGNVTAKSLGVATITVTTESGKKTDTCKVTVSENIIHVTSIELDSKKIFLYPDQSYKLTATVLPEDATNKNVTWSSLKPSIAAVDQNGNITAKTPGDVEIAVTTEDGWHTAICEVVVWDIPVTGVTLDKDRLELDQGTTAQLKVIVLPENATNKNVTWKSSDEFVAIVDQNGNVTAKTPGIATITVTTEDGSKTDTCEVTIIDNVIPVKSVILDKDKLELDKGTTAQLKATVLPEDATNRNVTWKSSDEFVAIVDQNGEVTAKSAGNATVTVTTEDGGYMAICKVTVIEKVIPVTSVSLDNDRLDLIEGESAQLTATVLPENATNKNVTWSSSDEFVATVDQNGNVTAKNPGTATITVTTEDGGYMAICYVNVTAKPIPVSGIVLNETKLELANGETFQLTATVLPENAANKNVTWSSSDLSIATVDQNGNVTAKNLEGISALTTITATTEDGGYTARCTIIVKPTEVVGYNYDIWGNLTVKYKLLSNNECRLLTKFDGDGENGYVDGAGVLRIPDHVVYNGQNYYVKRIPSEWSDGENNVYGIEFESNVSHLREICDYAFKGTDALDNYHHKVLTFPKGLEYIGTEAFYNVNRLNDNVMYGIVFPSTLRAINVRAFANAGRIGEDLYQNPIPIPGEITFKGNFNPENMREEAFSPIQGRNYVKYIRAPNIEIATNIANYISVVYEDDFRKIISHDGREYNYLIPMQIDW